MALVKKEFGCGEGCERGPALDPLLKDVKRLAAELAFGAGKVDVRMKGTCLGNEAAMGCG